MYMLNKNKCTNQQLSSVFILPLQLAESWYQKEILVVALIPKHNFPKDKACIWLCFARYGNQ